ncbi:hypothetical protein [Jiangella muralis]|uniref:hypothetical protein n=1 Tax=Jiangella muralis TaxID=702383 RepID=UPI00069FAF0B|nr:hypothetical protein [Jiangella muralis]
MPGRIAILCTTWFDNSHAHVLIPRLVEGYDLDGTRHGPDVTVAAVYLEQAGPDDLGLDYLRAHGIRRAETIGEAMSSGTGGIDVDGVVIIGEHGEYEHNEYGQQLYPRRRFFDAAVAAMVAGGRVVPVFNDKGLSYSGADAAGMVETARRLGFGLGAGSTIPLTWRVPAAAQWPLGAGMERALMVGFGPTERYGYHAAEGLQAQVERRAGGETGVASVRAAEFDGADARTIDGLDVALFGRALVTLDLDDEARAAAWHGVSAVIEVEYRDGLQAQVVMLGSAVQQFAVACAGAATEFSCQLWLQGSPANGHFAFLAAQIGALVRTGRALQPVERTLLSTGVVDAAMRSIAAGERIATPELEVSYAAGERTAGTGIGLPRPAGWTPAG